MEGDEDDHDVYLSGPFDAEWIRAQHTYTLRGCIHAVGVLSLVATVKEVMHLLLAFPLPLATPSTLSKGAQLMLDGTFLVVCNTVKVLREADDNAHAYYAAHLTVPAECPNILRVTRDAPRRVHIELLGPAVPDGRIVDPSDLYVDFRGVAFAPGRFRVKTQVVVRLPDESDRPLLAYAPSQYRVISHVVPVEGASVPLGLRVCTVVLVRGVAGIVSWVAPDDQRAMVWFPPTWPHSVPPELGAIDEPIFMLVEPVETIHARERRLAVTELRASHFMRTALALGDAVRTRSGAAPWTGIVAVDAVTGYELAHAAARAPLQHQHPTDNTSTEETLYVHPECALLERVLDAYEPRPDSFSVELFTTHEPCYLNHGAPPGSVAADAMSIDDEAPPPTSCSDFITLHESIIARVIVGSFIWSKTAVDMPLVHDLAAADAKRNHTEVRAPNRVGLLEALDNDLYKEVWWQLREYRHWVQSEQGRPYVIAFVCESLNGCTISRDDLQRPDDVEALTKLLTSVACLPTAIVADRTITAGQQPSVFANVALFDPPLTVRGPGEGVTYALPLRVLVAGPATMALTGNARKAYFKRGEGQPLVMTSAQCLAGDVKRAVQVGCAESDYRAMYWGAEPVLTVVGTNSQHEVPNAPDDTAIMAWLAHQGIITALVECSTSGFMRLVHQRLVDEVMFLRLPVVQQKPNVLDVNEMIAMARLETKDGLPNHELGLIDTARVGDSNMQFSHYIVRYNSTPK